MLNYILRRLLLMFPTLLGVTAVVFFVMALSPGGVGGSLLNEMGTMQADQAKALRDYYNKRYHLSDPVGLQYLRWLNQISPLGFKPMDDGSLGEFAFKAPQLGYSFSKGRPVTALYREALPVTLLLNLVSLPIVYVVAILSGLLAARYRGRWFDMTTGVGFLALWSVPTIWAGVLLIGFLANRQHLHLFPAGGLSSTLADQMPFLPRWGGQGFESGWLLDRAWHLCMPVFCMVYGGFAFLAKLTRGAVLENLSADFARTARAKGVSDRDVLLRHVFRNSLLPLITVAAGIIPGLLVGSVIIESIFSIPGMGKLTIDAIYARDRELVLAGTLIGGLLSLACILLADLAYAVADPRVSYD